MHINRTDLAPPPQPDLLSYRRLVTEAERLASIDALLAGGDAESPIWLFGYGSLLWRPGFWPAQWQVATVHGWRRALDVHAVADRGSVRQPGLWFGLAPHGSVSGVALRIPSRARAVVLPTLWRREMPDDAYQPRWVSCRLIGGSVVQAIAFVTNRASCLYAGSLDEDEIARRMATAYGPHGHARCYLLRTQAALHRYGMRDRIVDGVAAKLARSFGGCVHSDCRVGGPGAMPGKLTQLF